VFQRAHPLQSRCTHLPSSEWQCSSVSVVLLHPSRWHETPIIHIWRSYNHATVGKRAFPVSTANLWNSLPAHLTSAPSLTVFRQCLKTFLFRRFYPDLIIRLSELTFCCEPSSNFVIQATLKISLMMMMMTLYW